MAFEQQIESFEQSGRKTKKAQGPGSAPSPQSPKKLSNKQEKSQQQRREQESVRQLLAEERVYQRGVISIRDLIAPSSFDVNSSYLKIADVYMRTLFIVAYPRYVGVGWAAPVINLNWTLDISMFFYPIEAKTILKQLQKKAGEVEAQLSMDQQKGKPRDPLRETALRDIEGLRDSLTQGIEHFFQFAFYVTIYAKDKEELDRVSDDIDSLFGSKLIHTKRGYYQSEQGFNSTIPLGNDELQITFNMSTSPIASSFPFISSELTSDNGILYGINRHNNSLILFDRFSLQNANGVVFATSGAGKSYAVKLEIIRSMMLGVDVIVVDPEMEYKTLSDAVGGTYVNVSLSSESKINPFDLPRAITVDQAVEDIIRSAVITTKGLLRIMMGTPQGEAGKVGFTPEEDALLDRGILEAYAKKDITAHSDLAAVQPPTMQDLQEVLEGMTGAEPLVERLKKYTLGTFSGLFNSSTTVETNNQLVIFSVRDLEDELRPMAIYNIISYIWNVVRSTRKKRLLVIDEAWWLMQHEDSARFIFALVKRGRKYYLGVQTITQDVNDFLRSPYGQAIVTNSSMQLLMKQSPASADLVQTTFNLTDAEKYLLLEAGIGQGIFFAGSKHAAIQVVASYAEDKLVTTNPQQLLELEAQRRQFEQELEEEQALEKGIVNQEVAKEEIEEEIAAEGEGLVDSLAA
ncbi:TPA: conjugal transfer protein TraC [Candidatus Uhrbacteria bacterium]|nr:conjugal transfer protein TraC [Candidatus Uhrbacteria bacterium]